MFEELIHRGGLQNYCKGAFFFHQFYALFFLRFHRMEKKNLI